MSVRNLKALIYPTSVAVIGATVDGKSAGSIVMRNLLEANFQGPIMPVTPAKNSVGGVLAYPDVPSLPLTPDLAIIYTDPAHVLQHVTDLGEKGTKAAIVMTSLTQLRDQSGEVLSQVIRDKAKSYGMRLLGPNSMGLINSKLGLNASYAPENAHKGKIAFVSQSGAMFTAVLDWAWSKGIGFSHIIHTGDADDVGLGDLLDYLGSDAGTRAILLYVESLRERRNFMSAARAAARNKPVLMIKAGRSAAGAIAASSHTGALAGSDLVFDAAIRRAGMLRVNDIGDLFSAVETLARARPAKGDRLAIITNGGGIGVIAADDLVMGGGKLAYLPDEVMEKLNTVLPVNWSKCNPVDIVGDATGERYAKALNIILDSKQVDAVLVMYAPTAISDPDEVAESVIRVFKERPRANILTCWVGSEKVTNARRMFAESSVPTFETPGAAVRGFLHLLEYRRNQDLLMEVPASATDFVPDTKLVREIIQNALKRGDNVLSEAEGMAVLAAYGITTIETRIAQTPAEASRVARELDGPVALKILSPDIIHKSDVSGVVLNLNTPFDVEKTAHGMLERVKATYPEARINGFTVQRMAPRKPGAQELIIGFTHDQIFGPVILFGDGGVAVEIIRDRAVALPPLNMTLAAELVNRTRVAKLLKGYRDRPAANMNALYTSLIQVSQMVVDFPEITELDINPLRADSEGVIALDVTIKVAENPKMAERLAIRPYPAEQEEWFTFTDNSGRKVLLRPIRPEDEPNHHILISKITPEDIRFRFFGLVHELPHSEMARLTQIDYDREMAFIAELIENGQKETLGVCRTVTDPDNEVAEFAVLVRSDLKGTGLGKRLLTKMIEYCAERGTKVIVGQVLKDNVRMLKFVEHLGFVQTKTIDGDIFEVEFDLDKQRAKTRLPS